MVFSSTSILISPLADELLLVNTCVSKKKIILHDNDEFLFKCENPRELKRDSWRDRYATVAIGMPHLRHHGVRKITFSFDRCNRAYGSVQIII